MSSERSGLEFVDAIVSLALANASSALLGILIGLSQFLIPRTSLTNCVPPLPNDATIVLGEKNLFGFFECVSQIVLLL